MLPYKFVIIIILRRKYITKSNIQLFNAHISAINYRVLKRGVKLKECQWELCS